MTHPTIHRFSLAGILSLIVACTPAYRLGPDISLEPMYGKQPKTQAQLHGDRRLIEQARHAFGGDMRRAAHDAIRHGVVALHAGDSDKAIRRFNQAWLFDPTTPQVYEAFSGYLVVKGRLPEALIFLERAHNLDPADTRIRANLERVRAAVGP